MDSDATPTRAMQIGEIAQRTDLSLRTLRHYDEVGLLQPSGRSDGGFRLYTEEDLDKLLVIRRMKPLGFTLEEMVEVMSHIEGLRRGHAAFPSAARDDGQTRTTKRASISPPPLLRPTPAATSCAGSWAWQTSSYAC